MEEMEDGIQQQEYSITGGNPVDSDQEFQSNPFSQLFNSIEEAKTAAKKFKNAKDFSQTTLIGNIYFIV